MPAVDALGADRLEADVPDGTPPGEGAGAVEHAAIDNAIVIQPIGDRASHFTARSNSLRGPHHFAASIRCWPFAKPLPSTGLA